MGRVDWRRSLAVVLVAMLAGAAVSPAPALAHGTLVSSTPANGATVRARVDAVSLTFTEMPAPFAYFTITGPTGVRLDNGWSNGQPGPLAEPVREYQLENGEWKPMVYEVGFPVNVTVSHWPGPGTYTAAYYTVASDGDLVKGDIRFAYRGATVPAPPGWQPPTDQPKPELLAAEAAAHPSAMVSTPPQSQPAAMTESAPQTDTKLWAWLVPVLLIVAAALCVPLIAPQLLRRRRRP